MSWAPQLRGSIRLELGLHLEEWWPRAFKVMTGGEFRVLLSAAEMK